MRNPDLLDELEESFDTAPPESEPEAGEQKRTVLATWRELLRSIDTERAAKVSPALARRIIGTWTEVSTEEVPRFLEVYYDYLADYHGELLEVLRLYPDAVDAVRGDGDVNRDAYLELLFRWQRTAIKHDLEWDVTARGARFSLGAMLDAANFFVSGNGIVQHLSSINFVLTHEDNEAMLARIEEWKGEQ